MMMMMNRRPSRVQLAIDAKFDVLTGDGGDDGSSSKRVVASKDVDTQSDRLLFANNGHEDVKIFLDRTKPTFVTLATLVRKTIKSTTSPRILDLGTARGDFLLYLNSQFRLQFDCLTGISAVDQRETTSIPDASYVCCNLDNLHSMKLNLDRYDLVWSSATMYHLVDPFAAISFVYENMLRLSKLGSLAFLRDVPLAMVLRKSDCDARRDAATLTRYLTSQGFDICISEMPEKPGLYDIAMRRTLTSPARLPPMFRYSGDVHRISSTSGYTYASLEIHEGISRKFENGPSISMANFFVDVLVLDSISCEGPPRTMRDVTACALSGCRVA